MITELVIDHQNFKQNRVAYGISLSEIAERCGLGTTTVSNYERFEGKYTQIRARDDNSRLMIRALKEIIQEKLDETFVNSFKMKEDKSVEESREIKANNVNTAYDRKKIGEKIRKYCSGSKISISDFCAMCGLTGNTFTNYVIKLHPYMYDITLHKICNATGWTIDMLIGEEDIPINNDKPVKTTELSTAATVRADLVEEPEPEIVAIRDEKYTFENGEYFYEYSVVKRVKIKISKEKFLRDISKKEDK